MLNNACVSKLLNNLIWLNIIIAALFWIIDGVADYFLFGGRSLIDELLFPETREIWIRSFVFFIFALQGFIVQTLVDRFKNIVINDAELDCERSKEKLSSRIKREITQKSI